MAAVLKLDANSVGLRYAQETSIGVLPGSPIWYPLEPNSFGDFGGEITTVSRDPINDGRQRKKGVTVDLDASGSFETDLTQTNIADLMQGFIFADFRTKTELAVTGTVNGTRTYTVASGGAAFLAGDLLFAKNFATVAAANGLKTVSSSTATTVVVAESIGAANDTTGVISRVGFQFTSADLQIIANGSLWALQAATKNLTQLGIVPGEWIFIGGDLAANCFATQLSGFWGRVRSVSTTQILLDKTTVTLGADAGTGKTIRVFCSRVLKNEIGTSIKRRTYQLERTLGAPEDTLPLQIQSEYITGSVADTAEISIQTADKVTANLSFIGRDAEQRTGATGVKSGSRPTLVDASAFNTSSNVKRIKLSKVDQSTTNVTALFAFVTDMTISISNNVSPNKAVSVLGAFDMTAGLLQIDVDLTAYFADIAAVASVRNNDDLTADIIFARDNAGIFIDLPILAASGGRVTAEKDEAITIPMTLEAGAGSKIDTVNLNHTVCMGFFDYLPTLAM
jgi:hypothetical protein